MANGTTVVPEPETARPALTPGIPLEDHRRAVADGRDVPEERPAVALALDEVGIAGKTVWVRLPQGRIPFDAEVGVDLSAEHRGIHMSRIEEVAARLHGRSFDDLRSYARAFADGVIVAQHATRVRVHLRGKLPLLRSTPVSDRTSVESVEVSVEVRGGRRPEGVRMTSVLGLAVQHMTACPCTQRYNQVLAGQDAPFQALATHSQRTTTWLVMDDPGQRLDHLDLLACLEARLHVTQGLLKRPDEAEVVLGAHRRPQFAEDVVRAVAAEAARRFGPALPPGARMRIDSRSLESIHTHDVRCRLDVTLDRVPAD